MESVAAKLLKLDEVGDCHAQGVPFFFKQWGGVRKGKTGRLLDGRTYDEMPDADCTIMEPPHSFAVDS